jgi:hypothetical protein
MAQLALSKLNPTVFSSGSLCLCFSPCCGSSGMNLVKFDKIADVMYDWKPWKGVIT